MNWYHNQCCEENTAYEGSWTCIKCRLILTLLDSVLRDLQKFTKINEVLLQLQKEKSQEREALRRMTQADKPSHVSDPSDSSSDDDSSSDNDSSDNDTSSDDDDETDSEASVITISDEEVTEPPTPPAHSTPSHQANTRKKEAHTIITKSNDCSRVISTRDYHLM